MTLIQILNNAGLRRATTTLPIFAIRATSIALFSVARLYALPPWQGKQHSNVKNTASVIFGSTFPRFLV
jgi:hypothetical protein